MVKECAITAIYADDTIAMRQHPKLTKEEKRKESAMAVRVAAKHFGCKLRSASPRTLYTKKRK